MPKNFGHVEGVDVGSVFPDRKALRKAEIHLPLINGIHGDRDEGADSIVMSGGYVDDEDHGDLIIYTGQGGNDTATKKQIADQEMTRGNLGLAISCKEGRPVRVVRGAKHRSPYSPSSGYRYDGLYFVEHYWSERGLDGFLIWRFRLRQYPNEPITPHQGELPTQTSIDGRADGRTRREETTNQRIVRNTMLGTWVKRVHSYTCQICGTQIETLTGPYAEAAHIRPLGRPHDGPDSTSNILCLCPNCHVQLDHLALYVEPDNSVWSAMSGVRIGELRLTPEHSIDASHFEYQKGLCRNNGN